MDTRQVIARFEAERQALALMDHPNIAKVLDAGETASGRPFFVMELVRGVPITQYCDEARLMPNQRLELCVDVCRAIQHAHQKGIIHRDIKPSNVLVTTNDGKPLVKIIDFGVAKATGAQLTDKTVFTNFASFIGTPLYISPEQTGMNATDVDTRADIYSLGVLLYELITGTTPFEKERLKEAAFDEVRRIIREEEPPKPSTRLSTTERLPSIAATRGLEPKKLSMLVRGELDWIVMKCLEKDRNRRYDSATGLASDLQHYLANEPVQAHPPSSRYRLRKFIRRNKGPMLAASLALAGLVLGAGVSAWQAVRATRAGNRATKAEQAANDRAEGERQARFDAQGLATLAENRATAERTTRERAEQAEDKLERALARNLNAPLALRSSPILSEPECRSLWTLASSDSARLRLRFLAEGIATELDARQLLARSDYALIAAIGLNTALRRQAEELLLTAMNDASKSLRFRIVIACISLDLADDGSATARTCVNIIARGLSAERDDVLRTMIRNRLLASSNWLAPADAVPIFVQALQEETERFGRGKLAQGLAAVAGRIPPADAAALLLRMLEKELASGACEEFAEGLATIVAHIPPADAARVSTDAARILVQALEKEPVGWFRHDLARGMTAIISHMPPADAARFSADAARILMQALVKETMAWERQWLVKGLIVIAGQMSPADATRVSADTARLLTQAVAKSTNDVDRQWLTESLVTVAGHLPPADAASLLMQVLEKELDPLVCKELAQGLANVTRRLPPADAARVCTDAARMLGRALKKELDANPRFSNPSSLLAEALVTLAQRMPPPDATRTCTDAAQLLAQALKKESNADERRWLAIGLTAVTGMMPSANAARLLMDALERESDSLVRQHLAEGLVIHVNQMDRAEDARLAATAIRIFEESWNKGSRTLESLIALSTIIQRSEHVAATHASFEVAQRIPDAKTTPHDRGGNPTLIMEECLESASQPVVRQRASAIAANIGNLASNTWPGLSLTSTACEPLPCRFETRDLVELLKIPTYYSTERRVILDQLGNRYHQRFATHWDFVRYAEKNNLNLDFTTPPQRPDLNLPELFKN